MPQGIATIGKQAFENSYHLKESVIFPDSLTTIKDYAFQFCYLTSIILPDSVFSIGNYAFAYSLYLSSLVLPDSTAHIGEDTFYECTSLTLTVPKNSYALQYAEENNVPYVFKNARE